MSHLGTSLFYILAFTAISSALIVVTNRKPTYAVLSLTVTMIALSGLFVLLQAYFIAVIQILIYAGAILVLFLFVIMLLGIDETETKKANWVRISINAVLILAFLGELIIAGLSLSRAGGLQRNISGTIEAVGEVLFNQYLLPFELVSAILLIGIFGVVNLAQRETRR